MAVYILIDCIEKVLEYLIKNQLENDMKTIEGICKSSMQFQKRKEEH